MAFNLTNRTLRLPGSGKVVGTGWLPPTIDPRDYTEEHAKVKPMTLKFTQRDIQRHERVLAGLGELLVVACDLGFDARERGQ